MKLYHKNPRQIGEKEYEDLAEWLEELGDLSGIVHNIPTDEVIGGNQRARIFDIIHDESKIVIVEEYDEPTRTGTVARGYVEWRGERYDYRAVSWTPEQCEKANIVANKAGGDWDFDELANTWEPEELFDWGFEPEELGLDGWDDEEPPEDPGAQVDRAEELREEWGVEPGQLWRLGEHRLICGDCTDEDVVARVMDGERADMVFTDPPYGVNVVPDSGYIGGGSKRALATKFAKVINDDIEMDVSFLLDYASKVIIWGGNYFCHRLPRGTQWLVWDKDQTKAEEERLSFGGCELAWTNLPGQSVRKYKNRWVGFSMEGESGTRVHPNQKPVKLVTRILQDYTSSAEVVLDPFLGSGTTLIACERLGRKCRAVEIEPKYVAVALDRWATMTGREPELVT